MNSITVRWPAKKDAVRYAVYRCDVVKTRVDDGSVQAWKDFKKSEGSLLVYKGPGFGDTFAQPDLSAGTGWADQE